LTGVDVGEERFQRFRTVSEVSARNFACGNEEALREKVSPALDVALRLV
jgi:hypothetical protein